MAESDEALIKRVRAGDTQALGEFLTSRRAPLLAFIERRLGMALRRKVEPDDLLQDLSADAVRSLAEVDLGDRDPFSWLCQLAERRIIDSHRRFFGSQKRAAAREVQLDGATDKSRAGLLNLLVASMTTASQAVARDERQVKLLAGLDKLPADQREALRLRYLEGLPSKEIAARLGKTDGSVRVMLTRSLTKLQQILESDEPPERP